MLCHGQGPAGARLGARPLWRRMFLAVTLHGTCLRALCTDGCNVRLAPPLHVAPTGNSSAFQRFPSTQAVVHIKAVEKVASSFWERLHA